MYTKYEVWVADFDEMKLFARFASVNDAIRVARKKKELGFVGTIKIYKVITEEIKF